MSNRNISLLKSLINIFPILFFVIINKVDIKALSTTNKNMQT